GEASVRPAGRETRGGSGSGAPGPAPTGPATQEGTDRRRAPFVTRSHAAVGLIYEARPLRTVSMNPSTPTGASPPARQGWSAGLLAGLFLVAAALLFALIYITVPQNHEFTALLLIGVVALLFALVCYLAESASRDPAAQRSLAWGFLAMGFATLFLSVGLGPTYN